MASVMAVTVGLSPSVADRVLPRDDDLRAAAAVLDAGERVAILVGHGAAAPPVARGKAQDLLHR